MSRPGWNGRTIRNTLAYIIGRDGDACAICDHPGSRLSVDHELPVSTHPHLEWEPTNWKASHLRHAGHPHGCQHPGCTCPGNIARQATPLTTIRAIVKAGNTPNPTRDW